MKLVNLSLRFGCFKMSEHRSEERKADFQIEASAMTISVAYVSSGYLFLLYICIDSMYIILSSK